MKICLTVILMTFYASGKIKPVLSYGPYSPPVDEDGEPLYQITETIRRVAVDSFLNSDGWIPSEVNNLPTEEYSLTAKGRGIRIDFKQHYDLQEKVSFKKQIEIPIKGMTHLSIHALIEEETFLTIKLEVDGKWLEPIRFLRGSGKWETYTQPVSGKTVTAIVFSADEDVVTGNVMRKQMFIEIDRVEFQEIKNLRGEGRSLLSVTEIDFETETAVSGNYWSINSYDNIIEYTFNTENPHNGKRSFFIDFQKMGNKKWGAVFLSVQGLTYEKNRTYILRGYARQEGMKEAPFLKLQQAVSPYKEHGRTLIDAIGNDWTLIEVPFKTGGEIDPANLLVMIAGMGTGKLWLDDISILLVPEEKKKSPANIIYNGSFETGLEGWSTHYMSGGSKVKFGAGEERLGEGKIGNNSLKVQVPYIAEATRNNGIWITSRLFQATPGEKAVLSFWAKLEGVPDKAFQLHAKLRGIESYKNQDGGHYILHTNWTFYEIPVIIPESMATTYYLFLDMDIYYDRDGFLSAQQQKISSDSVLSLDAVQLQYGEKALEYKESEKVIFGYKPLRGHPLERIYERANGEKIVAAVDLIAEARDSATIPYEVVNLQGDKIASGNFKAQKGNTISRFELPSFANGSFKVIFKNVSQTRVISEYVYHIIPKRDYYDNPASPFGGHFAMNDYGLTLCRKSGTKWNRSFPLLEWKNLEHEKGKWTFPRDAIKKAKNEYGVNILPILHGTPAWASSASEEERKTWQRGRQFAPRDLKDWENYVRTIVTELGDLVEGWELWNEPNLPAFFQPGPGRDRADVWMQMMEMGWNEIKRVNPNDYVVVQLVAGAAHKEWTDPVLSRGVGKFGDAISYHYYSVILPEEMLPVPVSEQVAEWKDRSQKGGVQKDLGVWMSEGGVHNPPSWYTHLKNIPGDPVSVEDVCRWQVIANVEFLAGGTEKVFLYMMDAPGPYTEPVNINVGQGYLEWDGFPKPPLIAYSVMTYFLEGKKFVSFTKSEDGTERALFQTEKEKLYVLWNKSIGKGNRMSVSEKNVVRVFDMSGNSVTLKQAGTESSFEIDRNPFYVILK